VSHRSSGIVTVDLSAEEFGISATGKEKGKSSGLLTHEVPKGSKLLDQGRPIAVDLPLEKNFGIFSISSFQGLGDRGYRELNIRILEVAKPEIPFREKFRSCLAEVHI
jgi:hypothetical protein